MPVRYVAEPLRIPSGLDDFSGASGHLRRRYSGIQGLLGFCTSKPLITERRPSFRAGCNRLSERQLQHIPDQPYRPATSLKPAPKPQNGQEPK